MTIYGINPVIEALRANRVTALRVGARRDDRLQQILELAATAGVPVQEVSGTALDQAAHGGVHQGVVAEVSRAETFSVEELVAAAEGAPLLVVLDGIEDPHNLGAILRTAESAGVDGVVVQTRHSAARGGVVAKASAGAVAHLRIAEVVNVSRALEDLKELGVWTVGMAGEAPDSYDSVDMTLPTALVLGAEGPGLRRLVRERCDRLVSIPLKGQVGSLNVSVAAGVALFEAVRQRRAG